MNRCARPLLLSVYLLAAGFPLFGVGPGEKAPPFANPDLSGRHLLSRDYLGKGWLIVDFFATDCEGCEKELPILESLAGEFGSRLPILVFATDPAGTAVVEPYFRSHPTGLTVLIDRYQAAVKRYGVSEIPSLFLIDPSGTIVLRQVGFQEGLDERIRAHLCAGG